MSFPQSNAKGANNSNALAGHSQPNWLLDERTAHVLKMIDEFFILDGIAGPTETINDLLNAFIQSNDPEEPYEQNFMNDTVLNATLIINFLSRLGESRRTMISLINSTKA